MEVHKKIDFTLEKYYKLKDTVIVTYLHKLNLFNFKKGFK